MTSQVMQMLGTRYVVLLHIRSFLKSPRYEVEPSFFLSSVNSIPSNYQDDPKLPEGDREWMQKPGSKSISSSYFQT